MLKMYFMRLSEARPWGWPPEQIKLLNELYTCMDQLRALRPDDARVAAYYNWTHTGEPKPRPELPPAPEGVPEWAWYQVKLLELCERVPEWWIDTGRWRPVSSAPTTARTMIRCWCRTSPACI